MIFTALFPYLPGIQTFYMYLSSHLMSLNGYSVVFLILFCHDSSNSDLWFLIWFGCPFWDYSMHFYYIYKLHNKYKNPKTKSIIFFFKINLKRAMLKCKLTFSYEMKLFHFIPNLLELTHRFSIGNWQNVFCDNSTGF